MRTRLTRPPVRIGAGIAAVALILAGAPAAGADPGSPATGAAAAQVDAPVPDLA